ncbi:hypothetical protein BFW01_g11738 [Lasiodiplodia theobromae]|nr:hypothetical protein BFW01_g11738 [Lasiodiplodia theobromae]
MTVLRGFDYPPTSGDWDPTQGSTLIVGSQDSTYGLRSWTESGSVSDEWGESYRTNELRVSEDGQTLVTITDCGLHKYRMETKEKIGELVVDGARLISIDMTKDSRHILLNNGGTNPCLIIVDSESDEVVRAFDGPSHSRFIIRSAFGGLNDEYVLSGSEGM